MIGVCQPVRPGSRCGHDGSFLEQEHRFVCSREREDVRNRLESFGIGDCVSTAIEDPQLHALLLGDPCEELRAVEARAPDLEMRRAGPAQGASAQESATQIGGATAGSRNNPAGRVFEGRQARAEDAGFVHEPQRSLAPCGVELVSHSAFEGPTPVGADLRRDAERPQQAERSTRDGRICDVEVDRDLSATFEMLAACRMEEPGQLG